LARQARAHYDEISSLLTTLETAWRSMTVETVEWRALAAASDALFDLRKKVGIAKAHAAYCENCHEVVRSKVFALRWMMENYDRQHGGPSPLRSPVQTGYENDRAPSGL
jgi:hypothetical protein